MKINFQLLLLILFLGSSAVQAVKDWTKGEWKKEKGSYGLVFPYIDKSTTGKVTAEEY